MIKCGLTLALSLFAVACGDRDSKADLADTDAGGDGSIGTLSYCAAQEPLVSGVACAVVPSSTAAAITDTFAYHAVGIPNASNADSPVFVYLKGSGGIPYEPSGRAFNDVTMRILQEGVDRGYVVLMLAYDRVLGSTLDTLCADDLACYERIRHDLVEGSGDPLADAESRAPNDILSRLAALVTYLSRAAPGRFPGSLDWTTTRIGGHSQGAGHAGFIAKQLHTVAGACLLAGLGDSDAAGTPATWLTSATWATPRNRVRGLIHEQDPWFAKSTAAWTALGLQLDQDWRKYVEVTANPHGFVQSESPDAVAGRLWACLE